MSARSIFILMGALCFDSTFYICKLVLIIQGIVIASMSTTWKTKRPIFLQDIQVGTKI